MRLWHYALLKYLPDLQFKGQHRDMVAIMHDWRDKGETNHLLINKVMEFPRADFARYFIMYEAEYYRRYGRWLTKTWDEFRTFVVEDGSDETGCFDSWHDMDYLRVCMANLYEKHRFGVGKSRITDKEWETLVDGYREITGEYYIV